MEFRRVLFRSRRNKGCVMGRVRRIALETRVFEKVGDATNFFSTMLKRYSVGAYVSETDAKDLMALLKRHNERDEKIGSGIDHFEVDAAPDVDRKSVG